MTTKRSKYPENPESSKVATAQFRSGIILSTNVLFIGHYKQKTIRISNLEVYILKEYEDYGNYQFFFPSLSTFLTILLISLSLTCKRGLRTKPVIGPEL